MSKPEDVEKIKTQLLNLMSASKGIIDARQSGKQNGSMDAAIEKLQHEYVQAIVMLKAIDSNPQVPALLKPNHGALLERQMFSFKESLSVGLEDA